MSEKRLAGKQLTQEEAIAFVGSKELAAMTPCERGLFQLRQDRLCMDFGQFHEGITELLRRPVYTHEFADPDALWREYQGRDDKPDLAGIIGKLPSRLRGVIVVTQDSTA